MFEMSSCAVDGEFFFIQQMFDSQNQCHILPSVKSLARIGSLGPDLNKFRFPESKDIGGYVGDLTDFTDLEVNLIGNGDRAVGIIFHRRLRKEFDIGVTLHSSSLRRIQPYASFLGTRNP